MVAVGGLAARTTSTRTAGQASSACQPAASSSGAEFAQVEHGGQDSVGGGQLVLGPSASGTDAFATSLPEPSLDFVSFGVLGNLHRVVMVERMVPDELWELFQRVVPPAPTRPQGGGRRRYGDREVLAAIIFVATTGCTWRQLPPVFGPSGPTAHRRFTEWTAARVWAKLHRVILDELGSRGDLDWSRCAIDSVNMRALKGGT